MKHEEGTDAQATLPAPEPALAPTPWTWRASIIAAIALLAAAAYAMQGAIGPRGQAVAGLFFFFGLVAAFSSNLRAVNWRTIGWGIALQAVLALLVLKVPLVKDSFDTAKFVVVKFIEFSDKGAE